MVLEHLPHGACDLVDVGAGSGVLGAMLAIDRPDVRYGFIEPIPSLERLLERRFGKDANLKDVPRFDGVAVVTLMDVLEHQADDRGFITDLVRRMDPGATLVLTVPALPSLWSAWDVALGHHRRYTPRLLLRTLRGLGLRVRELSFLFPELVPAAWLRRFGRPASRGGATHDALFPEIPDAFDRAMYALGRVSVRLRRWWPAGTSLLAVVERRG